MTKVPIRQKAIWSVKETHTLVDLDVPTPQAGEVLIANVWIASNPKDVRDECPIGAG
jgi:NADPH:quinone reductase-like Zn-dependent oxidoreductase